MTFPQIDPVIFSLGPLQVRWYGLMYVIGFLIAGFLLKKLVQRNFFKVGVEKIDSLITTMLICMFLGARLIYVFVYNWDYYSHNLAELLSVWKGGLSFHGAIIGLVVGGIIFARRNNIPWFQVMDSVALAGCPGLFFGRMGNFINGELYGRVTDSPLGMVFPNGGPYPRHPSQLYEGILEGVVLTLILWLVVRRVKVYGIICAFFLIGYGSFRYFVEFFREADKQLGYYFAGTTTMGQILCLLMIIAGVLLMGFARKKNYKV
ncbi:prolipoprotein diacylglyceryl transferase [Halobacteriovorax sp. GB3]|uniref:prolipoprotein diacylglyceryl transferase n=1 Tax=Halobacteriovorax sp. GB3 TaxID=2719615 RepID=UPI0023616D38|nr:prolipoprotein diacylglyceryl transferase [Halobacteriovorax sp. GB3]MDD0852602.1 prolipoprotein diacylglyceryl transferase [Halobacteriovorax sp. GB3]